MANTGLVLVRTGENNAGIGATAWANPGNVTADDTTDSICVAAASSQYQVGRNADLTTVPTNATITGITVTVEASEHSSGTEVLSAKLQDASGTLFGSTKTNTISGTSKAVYTYGSGSDLWSAAITPDIVHDADFGVRLWFTTAHEVRIDYIKIQVDYTLPTHGNSLETDTAVTVAHLKILAMGMATETDSSQTLTVKRVRTAATGMAQESNYSYGAGGLYVPLKTTYPGGVVRDSNVDDSIGDTTWTDPSNITTSAPSYATCAAESGSYYLIGNDCDLSAVPANAGFAGITVTVNCAEVGVAPHVHMNIELMSGGTPLGTPASFVVTGPTYPHYIVGSKTDTWGATLTTAIVKGPGFGVRMWYADTEGGDVSVDWVTITVETVPASPGISVETDAAQAPTVANVHAYKEVLTGTSTETDAALGLGRTKVRAVGVTTETDASIACSVREPRAVGIAEETDSAQAPDHLKSLLPDLSTETDSALGVSHLKLHSAGIAEESDSALELAPTKVGEIGLSYTTDEAPHLAVSKGKAIPVLVASEADSAFEVGHSRGITVAPADEGDEAVPVAIARLLVCGIGEEADEPLTISMVIARLVGMATETDTPPSLVVRWGTFVRDALEADESISVSVARLLVHECYWETDLALSPSLARLYGIASSEEAEESLPCNIRMFWSVETGEIVETDTAFDLNITMNRLVGKGSESDSSMALGLVGGIHPHNNMPPYQVFYVWRRVS